MNRSYVNQVTSGDCSGVVQRFIHSTGKQSVVSTIRIKLLEWGTRFGRLAQTEWNAARDKFLSKHNGLKSVRLFGTVNAQ